MAFQFLYFSLLALFSFLQISSGELELVWANAEMLDDKLIWTPVLPSSDYFALGHYVHRNSRRHNNAIVSDNNCKNLSCWERKIPVARATGQELAMPIGFHQEFTYNNKIFWKMSCPGNYVALSGIATRLHSNAPVVLTDSNSYRCILKSFVQQKDLYFYLYANGKTAMWAMPVEGRLIGSFFTLSEPNNQTYSATGYQLIPQPKEIEHSMETFASTAKISRLGKKAESQNRHRLTAVLPIQSTTSANTMDNQDIKTKYLLVIAASAAILASLITAGILSLLYCSKYKRLIKITQQGVPSSDLRQNTRNVNAYRRKHSSFHNPAGCDKEMHINILYGHYQNSENV